MSDFTDLVARAVNPTMSRQEREAVYGVVREAILRMQEQRQIELSDVQAQLQRHLVEETIRDVEADITRYLARQGIDQRAAGLSDDLPPLDDA